MGRVPRPMSERLWSRVRKSASGCWEWTGSLSGKGYGEISNDGGIGKTKTHRAAWELTYGPIPDGLCVLHRCDNPLCCRPDHLSAGGGRSARHSGSVGADREDAEVRARVGRGRRHRAG